MQTLLKVAEGFSKYPAGRFLTDGPYSGEAFRKRILEPAIRDGKHLTLDLDGTRGYGSSFLEEAFGGLVRAGFSAERIKTFIELKSKDSSLIQEIWDYVNNGGTDS